MTEQKDNHQHISSLVSSGFETTNRIQFHTKAMTETVEGYPERTSLPKGVTWQTLDRQNYHPAEYTAEKLLGDTPPVWADPQDISKLPHDFISYEGEVEFDTNGRPLNPIGPTGITGRGVLGRWGANFAVDAIVTRINIDGFLEMVTIQREDGGEFATPGGFVDENEETTHALQRELEEETTATLSFESATPVYTGYVDDPRNTDNAWIETNAYHRHLARGVIIPLEGKDDARDARWRTINKELLEELYASHAFNVKKAIALWGKKEGKIVDSEGKVLNSTK